MGGRLSVPSGPDGISEKGRMAPRSQRFRLTSRTIIAPLTTILLASLFFIYSRTTIRAAKVNAQRHRDADGGTISWRNEALRRHGALERPEERTLLGQLFSRDKEEVGGGEGGGGSGGGRGERGRGKGGGGGEDAGSGRVETEGMKRRRREVNPIEEGIRRARERGVAGGKGKEEEGTGEE